MQLTMLINGQDKTCEPKPPYRAAPSSMAPALHRRAGVRKRNHSAHFLTTELYVMTRAEMGRI